MLKTEKYQISKSRGKGTPYTHLSTPMSATACFVTDTTHFEMQIPLHLLHNDKMVQCDKNGNYNVAKVN